jgi:hypothetical protein
MATYTKRIRQTTRHEYVLPNPSNWAEFDKAMDASSRDFRDHVGSTSDDSIWVTHADEEIIIYWEENN